MLNLPKSGECLESTEYATALEFAGVPEYVRLLESAGVLEFTQAPELYTFLEFVRYLESAEHGSVLESAEILDSFGVL